MARKRCLLVVMAKAPVVGRVKTRLIASLGKHRATRVYRQLLDQTIQSVTASLQYDVMLSCAPDITHSVFQRYRLKYPVRLQQQPGGSLGMRMSRIISYQLKRYDHVILTGSDLSNLSAPYIEYALNHLKVGSDLVLGVTDDGGYGLIGLNQTQPALFRNIRWSTASVSRITLQRARRLRLNTAELKNLVDIDTYADYRHWIKQIRGKTGSHIAIL